MTRNAQQLLNRQHPLNRYLATLPPPDDGRVVASEVFAQFQRTAAGLDHVRNIHGRNVGSSHKWCQGKMCERPTPVLLDRPTMSRMPQIVPVDPTTPGGRVRAARKAAGETQIELADRAGVSRSHLAHIERNTYRGGRNSWEAVAGALNKPLDYFLGGSVSIPGGEDRSDLAKDPNEVALLNLWRKLSPRGRAAFASVLLEAGGAGDSRADAIRLSWEGDDVIVSHEFPPLRQAGGQ